LQNNTDYQEEELSFIISYEFPEEIINKIRNTETIENYELKNKHKSIKIIDTYYDVSEEILQKNKYSLRIRTEENGIDKKKLITLKGPTQMNDTGNPIRIEIEKEWNSNEIKNIFTELAKLIPYINNQVKQLKFDSNPTTVLEKMGFKEIQERKTNREEIGILIKDNRQHKSELAKLFIDHVVFFFNKETEIKYFNIEIELNKDETESNKFSSFLSDFKNELLLKFSDLKEWPHSKYLTGKAIQILIKEEDKFQESLDQQGNLKYTAYTKIDKLINEKSV
jgi:hypothetical protein